MSYQTQQVLGFPLACEGGVDAPVRLPGLFPSGKREHETPEGNIGFAFTTFGDDESNTGTRRMG